MSADWAEDCRTALETRTGYRFRDKGLLAQALTHASYAHESPEQAEDGDYERLEYLGDAVLEMVSSDFLFRRYETLPEGELTRMRATLVCEEALFACAKALELSALIRLGKGERLAGGNQKPSIVSDVLEALIGALYLDGGLAEASRFIHTFVLTDVEARIRTDDAKSKLQEWAQRAGKETLHYVLTGQDGPEHDKTFTSAVYLGERFLADGAGKSKKASQQEAARTALKNLCI